MKPLHPSRRNSLHQTGATFDTTALSPLRRCTATIVSKPRPAATLEQALKMLDSTPCEGERATSLWMADIHSGGGKPEDILPPMTAEIAPMNPRPACIGVVGDRICAASRSFGAIPNQNDRRTAPKKFRTLKPHDEALAQLAPVSLTILAVRQ